MASALAIYLQNHEAAGRAGRDLARRTAASQSQRPYGDQLQALADDIDHDLGRLRSLMRGAGCRPNALLGPALQLGERIGRLKPNGRILRRSPLTDLIEIEALLDAVQAKRAGWSALEAAAPDISIDPAEIEELERRADDQIDRLRALHRTVSARVLQRA